MDIGIRLIQNIVYRGLEMIGRYYSTYDGYVVDNADPEGWGRVKLVVPGIIDTASDYWAWGTGQIAGKNFGCMVIPPIGTMIHVNFKYGDSRKPMWKFSHFGRGDIEDTDRARNVNIFWFQSPKGHLVELDDDKEEIRITDKSGNVVHLTSKGISIDTDQKIFLGDRENGDEVAALGNMTATILKTHNTLIGQTLTNLGGLTSSFSSLIAKAAASATPIGAAGVFISEGAKVASQVKELNISATNISSQLLNVDKSIGKVKSKKVVIDG